MPAERRLEVRALRFHSVSAQRERKERLQNRVALEGPLGWWGGSEQGSGG